MAYANLNRLTQLRDQGVVPQGRRSTSGPQERSKPTGFTHKAGNVTLSELEFSNGYIVGAFQVEGQKAIIKGPEATVKLLEAIDKGYLQECCDAWLKHVDSGLKGVRVSDAVRAEVGRAHPLPAQGAEEVVEAETPQGEARVARLEEQVDLMGHSLNEILGLLKQPKQ